MKALKILSTILLGVIIIGGVLNDAIAETRTLTSMVIVTIKAPETESPQAPKGLDGLYNVALAQSQDRRIIKAEEPLNTPNGLPRYTMSERL